MVKLVISFFRFYLIKIKSNEITHPLLCVFARACEVTIMFISGKWIKSNNESQYIHDKHIYAYTQHTTNADV